MSEKISSTPQSAPATDTNPQTSSNVNTDSNTSKDANAPQKPQRLTNKQKRSDFESYTETFFTPVKIDRHSINIDKATVKRANFMLRKLSEPGITLSMYIENIVREHLDSYANEHETWRKL